MTAPARIRKDDVRRAFIGAKEAGFDRVRVTIDPAGNLVIDAGMPSTDLDQPGNPLDRLFQR